MIYDGHDVMTDDILMYVASPLGKNKIKQWTCLLLEFMESWNKMVV